MFHNTPPAIRQRMRYLEEIDQRDRMDGTPQVKRLRQVPPDTGRFLALLAANAPEGAMLEIGTSAGYSSLWLALACELLRRELITFEFNGEKAALARETFRLTGVEGMVKLIVGNAADHLPGYDHIAFCFLDAEKEVYEACYDLVVPRLVSGGLLLADNTISHQQALSPFLERAMTDERVDAVVVPIGKGVLMCRKI